MLKRAAVVSYTLVLVSMAALSLTACQPLPFQPPVFELKETADPFDMAINSSGGTANGYDYFVLTDGAGNKYFTRDGAFELDHRRNVIHSATRLALYPTLTVPPDMTHCDIGPDGRVLIKRHPANEVQDYATVTIARFSNPGGLTSLSKLLYMASQLSGPPIMGRPGRGGFGSLVTGFIESPTPQEAPGGPPPLQAPYQP